MKQILFIAFCLIAGVSTGQLTSSGSANQAVSGEIVIPALQSIKVEMLSNPIVRFEKPDDINSPKIISGFCRITVISSVPWVINVGAGSDFLESSGAGTTFRKIPSEIIGVRPAGGDFISVTSSQVSILRSSNDLIQNTYLLDLKISPSVKYESGKYNANILFTITPD